MNPPASAGPRLRVVYESEDILALAKPAGQAVIAGRGLIEEPLESQARKHAGGKIFVVHRIDREASGLVVFAKNAAMHRRLSWEFESRRVRKTYRAVVLGALDSDGSIDKPLRLCGSGRSAVSTDGKPSLTRYRILERLAQATVIEAHPWTGRRHQLRVHFFSLGRPILGDPLYGTAPRPVGAFARLMLHALELKFPPLEEPGSSTASGLILRVEPDEEFQRLLNLLRDATTLPHPIS